MTINPRTIATEDLRPADVLLGRGKLVHNHPGNTAYRMDVKCQSTQYESLDCMGRDAVARHVLELVHQRGGRFLRRTINEILWETCPDRIALTKVKQALRDSIRQPTLSGTESADGRRIQEVSASNLITHKELRGPGSALRSGHIPSEKRPHDPQAHYDSVLEELSETAAASTKSTKRREAPSLEEFANVQRARSQRSRERQSGWISESSNAKRTRYDPTNFHSMRTSQGEMYVALGMRRQESPISNQIASFAPLHQLRQMGLRDRLLLQNHSTLQSTIPTAHLGTLVPNQHTLNATETSRREVPHFLQTPSTLFSDADAIQALRPTSLMPHPTSFMDNETAIVLRRLREGYTGNSSPADRHGEVAVLGGSQDALLEY